MLDAVKSRLDELALVLGLDRIEYDNLATMSISPEKVISTGRGGVAFFSPVVSWWIQGKRFYGAVPVTIKMVSRGLWGMDDRWDYDSDAMELAFCRMVRDSQAGNVEYR